MDRCPSTLASRSRGPFVHLVEVVGTASAAPRFVGVQRELYLADPSKYSILGKSYF